MPGPVDSYEVGSGQPIYGGMLAPSIYPAWRQNAVLNEWMLIANTAGAGGAHVDDFSGFAYREDTNEILIAAAGGHGGTLDNRVVSLGLNADAPTWTQRKVASTVTTNDTAYYPDGTPASRHTYASTMWIPQRNRLMLHGLYGTYPNASSFRVVDGFNPDTNAWDAAGTWPNGPTTAGWYGFVRGKGGDVWWGGGARWNQASNTFTAFSFPRPPRFPGCYDSKRDRIFTLQYGDGQGGDVGYGLWASVIAADGTQTLVALSGPALAELQTNMPVYSGMDYDPILDKYFYYPGAINGNPNTPYPYPDRVYVIDPDTYAVTVLSLGAGSVTPTAGIPAGVNARFKYSPFLKGFVLLPRMSSNLYFLRTA